MLPGATRFPTKVERVLLKKAEVAGCELVECDTKPFKGKVRIQPEDSFEVLGTIEYGFDNDREVASFVIYPGVEKTSRSGLVKHVNYADTEGMNEVMAYIDTLLPKKAVSQ